MFKIFEKSDYWFLKSFKIEGNQLTIDIAEGIISANTKDVRIDNDFEIKDSALIEVNEKSRKISIIFHRVLAHQLTDESYSAPECGETEGNVLCIHQESSYLKYVKANSLVSQLIDEPVFHYSVSLADHMIDVITTEKPELRQ